jgi:hypothetical protein
VDPQCNGIDVRVDSPIPNGSHPVMAAAHASGNAASTLFVREERLANIVDAANPGLRAFDIAAIDLRFAEDSVLALTPADLESLCAHSDRPTIHGVPDDTVDIPCAVDPGRTTEIGGRSCAIDSFGGSGSLIRQR